MAVFGNLRTEHLNCRYTDDSGNGTGDCAYRRLGFEHIDLPL